MATRPDPTTFLSPEEFLVYDREAESRNEYLDGRIIEITGVTRTHSRIVGNLAALLIPPLRARGCTVYTPGVRVEAARPRRRSNFFSPDIAVVWGESWTDEQPSDVITDPLVIIEVLSPSTADYDRGTKWDHYRNIVSLQDYLLVAQEEPRIGRYTRHGERFWLFNELTEPEEVLQLDSIGCTLALRDVYENAFDTPADADTQTDTEHG